MIAVVIGVVSTILAAFWAFVGSTRIASFAIQHLGQNVPITKGGPRPDSYANQIFYVCFMCALLLATGFTAALLVLQSRGGFRTRIIIYFVLLAILLPVSLYNYTQNDIVLKPKIQLGLDLMLIFISATLAMSLSRVAVSADDGRVLKAMTYGLLMFGGVLVPTLFVLIWVLVALNVISRDSSTHITIAELAGLSAVGSVIIAWLKYRREGAKQAVSTAITLEH
jgi:hypothetical protein